MDEIIKNIKYEVNEIHNKYSIKKSELLNYERCNDMLKTNNYKIAIHNKQSNKIALVKIKIIDAELRICQLTYNLVFDKYMIDENIIKMNTQMGLIPNYIFEDIEKLKETDFVEKYKQYYIQKLCFTKAENYWEIDLKIPFEWL